MDDQLELLFDSIDEEEDDLIDIQALIEESNLLINEG